MRMNDIFFDEQAVDKRMRNRSIEAIALQPDFMTIPPDELRSLAVMMLKSFGVHGDEHTDAVVDELLKRQQVGAVA